MTFVDFLGWAAALTTFAAFSMKTMLPLRIAAIASNIFFISYGALSGLMPVLALHLALLPFNIFRLFEIQHLIWQSRRARGRSDSLHWLRQVMQARRYPPGARVFRQGDPPDALYYLDEGTVRLDEIGLDLAPGDVFGEIAFFSEDRSRTLTATCLTPCRILSMDEASFLSVYYRNPELGLAIVRLITDRLLQGMRIAPQAYVARQEAAISSTPADSALSGRETPIGP